MIRLVLRYLRPRVGRFSPSQLHGLGEGLAPPGFLAVGPLLILVDLPRRFQKADVEPSLEDLNAYLKGRYPVVLTTSN